jgi:hypothetical protein
MRTVCKKCGHMRTDADTTCGQAFSTFNDRPTTTTHRRAAQQPQQRQQRHLCKTAATPANQQKRQRSNNGSRANTQQTQLRHLCKTSPPPLAAAQHTDQQRRSNSLRLSDSLPTRPCYRPLPRTHPPRARIGNGAATKSLQNPESPGKIYQLQLSFCMVSGQQLRIGGRQWQLCIRRDMKFTH